MRVTLERSVLLATLGHVHRVVERRNTIPILSNVLLRATEGELLLKATDLDIEVAETATASVEQTGATTVPAHLFFDIIRKLPDGSEVMLASDTEAGQLKVVSGNSRFSLQMLPDTDFPDITAGEFSHQFKLKTEEIKRLIDKTQFAISNEETRYYLNGIYLHTVEEEGKLLMRAVATDGHRLALAQMSAPSGSEGMPNIIIPKKAVGEIQKLAENEDGDLAIQVSDSKIRVNLDSIVITSKLIDGTFPDYDRVIPSGNDKALTFERQVFAKAVDRVSTISSDRGRAVKLALENNHATLSVNNPESGSANEQLDVSYDAEDLSIGFNSRYLLEISQQLDSDEATFMLADSGSPTLIRDGKDADTLYVLMPMRV